MNRTKEDRGRCVVPFWAVGGGFATYEDEVEGRQSVEARRLMTSNIAPKALSLFAVFNEPRFTQPYGGDVSNHEVRPK